MFNSYMPGLVETRGKVITSRSLVEECASFQKKANRTREKERAMETRDEEEFNTDSDASFSLTNDQAAFVLHSWIMSNDFGQIDSDQRSIAMFVVFWFVRELVLGKKRPVHPFIFDCEGKAGTGKSKAVMSIHLIKQILVESDILTLEEVESRIIMITHNGLAASIAGIDTFDSKVVNTYGFTKSINRKFDQVLLTVTDEYSGMPGNKNMLLCATLSSDYFGGQ